MSVVSVAGRHDSGMRRRAKRSGREGGCWTYVPQEALEAAGLADTWPIYYRTWHDPKRPRVVLNLYPEP